MGNPIPQTIAEQGLEKLKIQMPNETNPTVITHTKTQQSHKT
jgi:hypothetical protein